MTDSPVGAGAPAAYKDAVDAAMVALCGESYSQLVDMAPAMDLKSVMIATACARDIQADRFARAFQRAHGLTTVAVDPEAASLNRYRAAVIAHGSSTHPWHVGTDGRAYCPLRDGGVLKLDVMEKNGQIGFVVAESRGAASLSSEKGDPLERVTAPSVDFGPICARSDIGSAVTDAVRIRNRRNASPALTGGAPAVNAGEPELEGAGMHI